MKTYMAKPQTVEQKWYIVDATNIPLGRVASQVASILKGKNKPEYTPHVDTGDYVIVINSDKVVLTGNKLTDKKYFHHSGYIGGMKEVGYDKLMKEKSDFVITRAVKGMLPHNSLGTKMGKKLKVYKDANHNHEAQKPELITIKGARE
ncbi:MAG: 50S ribosomal protein L13 [Clostridia bacterium]|nr:50S ribosomal protein L13 [Clostridia bacterium]